MTGKKKLEMILDGKAPPSPPHWELVFQLPVEMFGLDPDKAANKLDCHIEICNRLIDEFDWAVALPADAYSADMANVSAVKKACGSRALVVGYEGGGVFWMPNGDTIMDFVVRMYEKPEELHQEARRKCDAAKERYRQLVDAGADFLVGAYDFAFNDQPFISPAQFAEFVTPYLAELVACVHDMKKKLILHSDGCLTKILDQVHSTGIDGYQSVDPQGHMDIKAVREQYPDWILMGNVACNMLQDINEEKIRESVRYCMTHGGVGNRYIFSTSNCIFKGMPPESYRIMHDEYRLMTKAAEKAARAPAKAANRKRRS